MERERKRRQREGGMEEGRDGWREGGRVEGRGWEGRGGSGKMENEEGEESVSGEEYEREGELET